MMRVVLLTLTAMALVACKPQKPWSPYANEDGGPAVGSATASSSTPDQPDADIGDVEQTVFINSQLSEDSKGRNVTVKETLDRDKRAVKLNVFLAPPHLENLWAEFEIKCKRDFASAPVIVRASIMVEDKVAGRFSAVLGANASKSRLRAKVDLLKPFQGNPPDTFLAKIVGDLYLMPIGTDENKVNPETETSDVHSQALYGTMLRVEFANDVSPSAEPAPDLAPAEAGTAPEPAPAANSGETAPAQ